MANNELKLSEAKRRAIIRERTRAARLAIGWDTKQMARALGRSESAYKKYEERETSTLPTGLLSPFCEITGVDPAWLTNTEVSRRRHKSSA